MILRIDGEQLNRQIIRYCVVLDDDTDYLTQEETQSLRLFVYETDTDTEITPAGGLPLTVADCVFDTLQPWNRDNVGYNVRVEVPGEYFPLGQQVYRVEVKVTPTTGEAFYLDFVEVTTIPTYSANG